jgi:hypothetical protein
MHHLNAFVSFLVISVDFTRLISTTANKPFANIFIIVHDSDKQATSSHYHSNSVHADGSKMWGILLGNTVVTLREELSLSSPLVTFFTGTHRPRLNASLCVALPWGIMEYCRRATREQPSSTSATVGERLAYSAVVTFITSSVASWFHHEVHICCNARYLLSDYLKSHKEL